MSNPTPTPPFDDVRMRGFASRTSVADVITLIRQRVAPLPVETIRFDDAVGRVLTMPVVATVPVPHFDRAAFDGYAVRSNETTSASVEKTVRLVIIGEAFPGRPFDREIGVGEAIRIMTGSPMPLGA